MRYVKCRNKPKGRAVWSELYQIASPADADKNDHPALRPRLFSEIITTHTPCDIFE